MAISFTPTQQKVIELHNRNILVSAAAGSGKTAVLVERIIQMVCNEEKPVDIDRLLIVTFTNAAATEMRERIAAGIAQKLLENPESEHIQKQSTLLHNAQITTIDSFCLFIIRNHFNEIGLDPAFRVADEGEVRLLQQDTLKELLEDAYALGDENFHDCVEFFCPGGRESVLEQHILNLSKYAASFPWPEEWLQQRKCDYQAADVASLVASDYGQYLFGYLKNILVGCVDKITQVEKLCLEPDGPYMYGELVEQEKESLQKLLTCESLEELAVRMPAVTFGRLPSKKDDSVSAVKRELAKELRSEVKEVLQKESDTFFLTPLELAAKQGNECAAPVATLIDLVLDFDERMHQKKQEKKLVDFSDMEHYALDILWDRDGEELAPSAVAKEYRQYFHEVLIDEYQDSNNVQEFLLMAVSGEEDGNYNRFMVGDVKQSIYKFRLACPDLFLEKYKTYQDFRQGDAVCQRIDLSQNFRSRSQVVDSVNQVFSRMMSEQIGGIVYDDKAALYAGASYPKNAACGSELLLVSKPAKDMDMDAKEAEALAIAQKIKELKRSFQVTDKATGALRPVKYSDMVILLRTNSGWDEPFKKTLETEGIPVFISSKTGYFAANEVQELLQLLRVLDNPRQDIPLFGVMKSLFGGFNDEEVALIRGQQKKVTLYEAMCSFASGVATEAEGSGDPEAIVDEKAVNSMLVDENDIQHKTLQEKIKKFLYKIDNYRNLAVYMPIRELLERIVEDYDYLNYVTAMPAGSKRKANVEMLFTKASDFEKTSYFGLFHFVRYIEQLERYDVDYGEADMMDENADVLRIMSIHKSKGLEFPVTFVSGLAKRFNMQDVNQSLVVDMNMGLACDYVDAKRRMKNKGLRRQVLSRKMKEENMAEEIRILYVALTRAKEKLIMTGVMDNAAAKWEAYQASGAEHLSYLDFMEAGSYLDFLMPIMNKTEIEVSVLDAEELLGEEMREQIGLFHKKEALLECKNWADTTSLAELQERFAYRYPYENLATLYTKTTVSELKIAAMAEKDEAAFHTFEEKEVVPYIPRFRKDEEEVSGTMRGNAFHRAMELVNMEELLGSQFAEFPTAYKAFVQGLDKKLLADRLHEFLIGEVSTLRLKQEYLDALNERKIVNFLASELGYRMWAALRRNELYREQPFVLGVGAQRLNEAFPEDEKVLIQGIIDVFFIEDGEIVLLDYKTDVIQSMEELWNRYATQLDYYGEALERLMALPVKEKVLYSFYLEQS